MTFRKRLLEELFIKERDRFIFNMDVYKLHIGKRPEDWAALLAELKECKGMSEVEQQSTLLILQNYNKLVEPYINR